MKFQNIFKSSRIRHKGGTVMEHRGTNTSNENLTNGQKPN